LKGTERNEVAGTGTLAPFAPRHKASPRFKARRATRHAGSHSRAARPSELHRVESVARCGLSLRSAPSPSSVAQIYWRRRRVRGPPTPHTPARWAQMRAGLHIGRAVQEPKVASCSLRTPTRTAPFRTPGSPPIRSRQILFLVGWRSRRSRRRKMPLLSGENAQCRGTFTAQLRWKRYTSEIPEMFDNYEDNYEKRVPLCSPPSKCGRLYSYVSAC